MEVPKDMEKEILEAYPELGDTLKPGFFKSTVALGALKKILSDLGVNGTSGVVTHVGKIDGGVLLGITLRVFDNPETAYETRQKMYLMPVIIIG